MKLVLLLISILSMGFAGTISGGKYAVRVTRESSNLYKVFGQDYLIETSGCFEFANMSDALLTVDGPLGSTLNLSGSYSNSGCRVSAIYGTIDIPVGSYALQISRESANWYSVFGINLFIKTNYCYNYAFLNKATLDVGGFGNFGDKLIISNIALPPDECVVVDYFEAFSLGFLTNTSIVGDISSNSVYHTPYSVRGKNLSITIKEQSNLSIAIYNLLGQNVFNKELHDVVGDIGYALPLSKGVYILKLRVNGFPELFRITLTD